MSHIDGLQVWLDEVSEMAEAVHAAGHDGRHGGDCRLCAAWTAYDRANRGVGRS